MNNTEDRIKKALLRIEKSRPSVVNLDRRLSIAAVAEEAGVHRTTIINRYPKIADIIRQKTGIKLANKSKDSERIHKLEVQLSKANKEIANLKSKLAKAISIQASTIVNTDN